MPIEKTELLEDKVRVHYHLEKPYGTPDVDEFKDVFYEDIPKLSEPPKHVGFGNNSQETIYIQKISKTIVFIFDKYLERPVGPREENIYGPYLKSENQ